MNCLKILHFNKVYSPAAKCFGLLLLFFLSFKLHSQNSLLSVESRIKSIVQDKVDSVVRVKATRVASIGGKVKRLLKMGSGFFISKEGHVLTTGLLPNADRIWIEHDESYLLAEEVGHDPMCNLSLLKLLEPPPSIKYIRINEVSNNLESGSFLVGITCALEFQIGPTLGLLQSHEFSFGKRLFPTKMLRSSLALGPGEVGAPVFDLKGRFIGITHAALPDLKSSFLLPASACKRIRDDLILSGEVLYGWFGITTTRKLNESNSFDIVINGFVEDSPAKKSNLSKGDILLQVGKTLIKSQGDLANSSFFAEPDTILEFKVRRDNKDLIFPVQVTARPKILQKPKFMNDSLESKTVNNEVNGSQSLGIAADEKNASINF